MRVSFLLIALLITPTAASCSLDALDLSMLGCPCGTGHTCVEGRCVEGEVDAGSTIKDAGEDPRSTDVSTDEGAVRDVPVRDVAIDMFSEDSGTLDVPSSDMGTPDAGDPLCPVALAAGTVFQFDLSALGFPATDRTGDFVASVISPEPRLREGRCGSASFWRASGALVVPDSVAFELDSGSFDFWAFHLPGPHEISVPLSRDALGSSRSGHAAVFWSPDNRIGARLQSDTRSVYRCSIADQPLGEWIHIAVNFGPPNFELWVDGARVDEAGTIETDPDYFEDCSQGEIHTVGIAGNDNPWVIAADTGFSLEGVATPTTNPFAGALERVRLSSVRRDFTEYARK